MSEPSNASPVVRPVKSRWQIGLRSLFFLILAVSAWLGVIRNRAQTRELELRLDNLRSLSRELEVDDPSQIAVAKKHDEWMSEDRWDVYLPPGTYRLCVATELIPTAPFPPVRKSLPIASGQHRIAVDQRIEKETWKGVVSWDGSKRLTVEEPKEFSGDSSSTSDEITISEQRSASESLVLSRITFSNSSSKTPVGPGAPSNGLMIWIEPVPEKKPAR